jgi:hypothetical protein
VGARLPPGTKVRKRWAPPERKLPSHRTNQIIGSAFWFTPSPSGSFRPLWPEYPGTPVFALGLLNMLSRHVVESGHHALSTLPSSPYPPWTHLLPLSLIRSTALSTSPTPSRLPPCHPSRHRRMSIRPGCVHTRVTSLRCLNQSIVLSAPPSSHARRTSTVTFGLVRFLLDYMRIRNLTL